MSRLSPREKPCFDLGNWMQLVWNSLTQNRYGNHTPSCLLSWQSLTGLSGSVLAELERIKPSKPSSCCRQMTLPWAPLPARPRESCPHPQTPRQATWMLSTGVDGKGGAKLGLVASVRGGGCKFGADTADLLCSCSLLQVSLTATEQPVPCLPLPAAEPGRLQEQA